MSAETTVDLVRDRMADADAAVPVVDIAPFMHGDRAPRVAVAAAASRQPETLVRSFT